MLRPSRARCIWRRRSAGESAIKSFENSFEGDDSAGIIDPFSVYEGLLLPDNDKTSEGNLVSCPKCFANNWSTEIVFPEGIPPDIGAADNRLDEEKMAQLAIDRESNC